jgi:sec-independent protein translocase protein TatA
MPTLAAMFPNIGWVEMMVILGLGLLIFGRRLPEVGRSLGRGIVEFRKGLRGIEDEVHRAETSPSSKPGLAPGSPARPPLTSSGQDARVSRGETVEPDQAHA